MAHLSSLAALLNSADGVAAADDRDAAVSLDGRDSVANTVRTLREGSKLEAAHRTVPNNRLSALNSLAEELDRLRTNVETHPAVGNIALEGLELNVAGVLLGGELVGDDIVDGEKNLDALGSGGLEHLAAVGYLLILAKRGADLKALSLLEGVSHAAADDERINLIKEALDDRELIGDLSAAENSDERTDRILDRVAEELDFLLEEEARNGGLQIVGDDGRRSVGAVSRTERVVTVDVAVAGELLSHFGALSLKLGLLSGELFVGEVDALLLVILLNLTVFSLVEAGVLEKSDFARLESGYDFVGGHAVGNELNLAPELLGELFGDGLKRESGVRVAGSGAELDALRTAEVAHENEASALFENVLNRRKRGDDTGIVGDLAGAILSHGDVEIDTHYNALAVEFNIAQSLLCHFLYSFRLLIKLKSSQNTKGTGY